MVKKMSADKELLNCSFLFLPLYNEKLDFRVVQRRESLKKDE